MNPIYEKALDAIWKNVNGGIIHPHDFGKVVEMFNRLLDANQRVDNAEDIQTYLQKKYGVEEFVSHEIQIIYETLLHSRTAHYYWNEQFMQDLLNK
ncbi:MAG: hypothetical protein KAW56_14380 [Candidatus Marinimicrobia bacterium]|nr:hypothetical protein [candidate division WOR-3 bacterium]MCK4448255.1 hypothetical protein [Candidatus Neomarinimicrobiota bacterium]